MARYTLHERNLAAVGQTVNLSSSGALLRIQHPVRLGEQVEIAVEGHPLENRARVEFVAEGRVVRIESGCIAIQFDRHEFRISRATPIV